MWKSSVKARSQQTNKVIYPSTYRKLCAVLISVIFCSSMADGWLGSNWRFWSSPYLIVSNTSIRTGMIFVFTFHVLLTTISRFLYLLSFSMSFLLTFESSGMAISISKQIFSFLSCRTVSGRLTNIVQFVITGTSHIMVVLLTFMTLSQHLSLTCNPTFTYQWM